MYNCIAMNNQHLYHMQMYEKKTTVFNFKNKVTILLHPHCSK